ncbi:hypothetical protein [Bacillus fonticola]|uniref:hypothetical protein n=1 Tax=Bacillus fonticola TaxID=2728853 RepID=UPI0014748A4F|nr:hypothetical protein [Bacillus fonticola]
MDKDLLLGMFPGDRTIAKEKFKAFNEELNHDKCLDERINNSRKMDEDARLEIRQTLGSIEIAQVKSLPRLKRNEVLRKIKGIDGLSQRQAARILGVSANLIF